METTSLMFNHHICDHLVDVFHSAGNLPHEPLEIRVTYGHGAATTNVRPTENKFMTLAWRKLVPLDASAVFRCEVARAQ